MADIKRAIDIFTKNGFEVLVPKSTTISGDENASFVLLETDNNSNPRELEKEYLKGLLKADIVYCCNKDGYIGATAMFELGYLIAKGQDVYFQEQPVEELINSLIGEKYYICSPEKFCEMLINENEMWAGHDWFDKDHDYKPKFSF